MAAVPLTAVGSSGLASAQSINVNDESDWGAYPVTPAERAMEFVGAAHARIDRVHEMLRVDPGLARASWDWGFGDWETAIGAASHTGQIEIINLLIAHGARPTVFTLATLDRIDALRDLIEHVEQVERLEGPHSISLYRHAMLGKAERVLEYLDKRGIGDSNPFEIARSEAERYVGEYVWDEDSNEIFSVEWSERSSSIALSRKGSVARNLIPLEGHRFSPAGARHAKVEFDHVNGHAEKVRVLWSEIEITGTRSA